MKQKGIPKEEVSVEDSSLVNIWEVIKEGNIESGSLVADGNYFELGYN